MRISFGLLLVATALASPAMAQADQVKRGPLPEWVTPSELMPVPENAGGMVFLRRQDTLIHLDGKGQTQYNGFRIRILHPNALQIGNLSLSWNPASGAPIVHGIKVYRGNEVIDALEKGSFEILRREGQLEAAMLDGVLTAVLRVPDLRVGDELEFSSTQRMTDPTLGSSDAGVLFLAPQPAQGRIRLGLSWSEGREPKTRLTPEMAKVVSRSPRGLEIKFDNAPMLAAPKDAPARFGWQRVVEYSDFPDWAAISRKFAPLYSKAATLGAASPLKKEAMRIAAAHASPIDRASAALKLVQQDVRYVYVGLDGGNLTPATADETWQRRYGDCKGKTALLLALLGELGIEAEAVLANNAGTDDGLDERLPTPRMFDHVIVRARIDGRVHYLDGTLPAVAAPSLTPIPPYRWVLPLAAGGTSLERIEWRVPQAPDEVTLYEIDAREGFDKPARITTTTIVRGLKGLEQQVQLSGVTPAQLLSAMQQEVGSTWQTIDKAEWRYDPKARASIMTIGGTGTVDWDDEDAGGKSLILPGGGFSPPGKRIRAADQDQTLPYYVAPEFSCHVTTVRLPLSTKPAQWSSRSGFDTRLFGRNYYRAFELRDGAIRMVRGSRVEQPETDAESAEIDNRRIASFDNSMAVVYWKPTGADAGTFGKTPVPATYEIDWSGDDVPCVARGKS